MIQSKLGYEVHEDGLLSPPAKRQRISLCPSPISPYSPYQEFSEAQIGYTYPASELVEVPFTIKWNQHPEDCAAFPAPPNLNNYQFSSAQSEQHSPQPTASDTVSFSCVRRCICCLCPKPSSTPFSDLLKSMPPVDTSHAEEALAPFPDPFPELSLETVVSILSSCAQTGSVAPSSYHADQHRNHKYNSSLTVEGPFNSNWYIGGLTASTSFPEIKSAIECLTSRCRRDSDINARFTLIMENQYRSTVGEQIKGKLWDVTPQKVAADLYSQLSKFAAYLQGEGLFVKMTVYLQEPAVKLLSDNDVKKKRSVITIYEKEEASLIYAFYVAVRRNIIVKQKKATGDAKKKKELENQLTNVYRKGRKSLKKKTQSVLDKSKVLKTVDDSWVYITILHTSYIHVSLAQHNKALNVRLTNPLPKDPEDDSFEVMLKEDETWAIYVNFYMESEIRMAKEEKCLQELALAQEEAQRLSYQATAQHMVVEMLKEQLEIQPMARKHFSNEFLHFINNNFDTMRERLKKAEEKLEVCSDEVTKIQAKVRELVLLKDDMDKRKTRLYRKMDWYERLLPIEGIDNDTISNGIAPFTQNLGPKILIKGIKEMWFVGEMNSIDADKLLKGCDNGTFLVRLNNNRNYVLSVVNKRKVRHIRIHENEERHLCWLKTTKQFYSIELLVQFFQENSLGLQDREYTTKLMYPVYYK
ncbi:hypothetical protein ACHWQZ_G012264 [Mnemiopsis leidyi]